MKTTVIGSGRWGSFIAWYLDKVDLPVSLYGRAESRRFKALQENRFNGYLALPESIHLTTDRSTIQESDLIVISVPSQNLRGLMVELASLALENKIFLLCMKGMEIGTGKRLSQVVMEHLSPTNRCAVWLGPGHVQEFYNHIPNCMVIDAEDNGLKEELVHLLSSRLIRFYIGTDLIGNELGAALKNVVGIAAGMLEALGLTSLKGALMSRGTREVARFIEAQGGSALSAYGLCHLGDYEATVFSKYSHNRRFGEAFVNKESFPHLAEGYHTVQAVLTKADALGVEMPIASAVHQVLFDGMDPAEALERLFLRSIKEEF